jgi:hypothetical protein
MNIGQVLPAVNAKIEGKSRKEALVEAADEIMSHVEMLIPEAEKRDWGHIQNERFEFTLLIQNEHREVEQTVQHSHGLGRFFHTPVILDVMIRNMKLPVEPLQQIDTWQHPAAIADALSAALSFLDSHPQFLSYRFGYDEAATMYAGVVELRDMAQAADANGQQICLKPVHHYHDQSRGIDVTEIIPGVMHEM